MTRKPRRPILSIPATRNFAEKFYPARPQKLWSKARAIAQREVTAAPKLGLPLASNAVYIRWLKKESMLTSANKLALKYSGKSHLWQNPYGKPRPRAAVNLASVWYTAYPTSTITKNNVSILSTLGSEEMWTAFQEIGIKALHTGPMKRAGGLNGWMATPSIDGHFDRISTRIDPILGSEAQFRHMSEVAKRHGGIIIDDIVPGHTGKGADFRLAEMAANEYPGIYHMVEIAPADWQLLPAVPKGKDSVNIDLATEAELKKHGYIIGKLQRVIFYEPGVKETNWSATKPVRGVDGIKRRWVYLHYFKAGQPSINWLDPSFAGMKLVIGDALHSLEELGSSALRLDANGFLGIEKSNDEEPAWSEGHPLSEAANQLIASMVRKAGGFTFQELNLSVDDIKTMSVDGADLSYDFISRPAYHHALATGDTEFLRLTLRSVIGHGIDPVSLVHALQNHDELTFELVHFATLYKNYDYHYHNKPVKGSELCEIIRQDLRDAFMGPNSPYNLPFSDNGIACTNASVIAALLGYSDIRNLDQAEINEIKKIHLLLAEFNAWQPGVFALSGWDLSGTLTLDPAEVSDLLEEGDTRWINRGAYDLMGNNPSATRSSSGMPKAISLYGTLPEQLADDSSFAVQLKNILKIRETYDIAISRQIDIPSVSHKSLLVMVHQLTDNRIQVTALNFSGELLQTSVHSEYLPPGAKITNMADCKQIAIVDKAHQFNLTLEPYQGKSLLIMS
ncbi:MAG: maltose alpha-D-glucosyltransferase [Candidatus Saccharimonadales bacterium]